MQIWQILKVDMIDIRQQIYLHEPPTGPSHGGLARLLLAGAQRVEVAVGGGVGGGGSRQHQHTHQHQPYHRHSHLIITVAKFHNLCWWWSLLVFSFPFFIFFPRILSIVFTSRSLSSSFLSVWIQYKHSRVADNTDSLHDTSMLHLLKQISTIQLSFILTQFISGSLRIVPV